MNYSWDPKKANRNFEKHGVRFPDAIHVLEDERALLITEVEKGEERSVYLGMDARARILVVVCAVKGENVRIISARKAARIEQMRYGVK